VVSFCCFSLSWIVPDFLRFCSSCLENIKQVSGWYKSSFAHLRSCPVPNDPEKEAIFAKVIETIYEKHSATLITMAKGANELRNMLKTDMNSFADHDDIQKRLDEFYMSRIGIRMVSSLLFLHSFTRSYISFVADWAISDSKKSSWRF
jgi:hypothetical protein